MPVRSVQSKKPLCLTNGNSFSAKSGFAGFPEDGFRLANTSTLKGHIKGPHGVEQLLRKVPRVPEWRHTRRRESPEHVVVAVGGRRHGVDGVLFIPSHPVPEPSQNYRGRGERSLRGQGAGSQTELRKDREIWK